MSYTEVLTEHGVTVEIWNEGIFEEYLGQVFWAMMMGESDGAVIQLHDDLQKQAGDAITLQLRSQVKGGHVTGASQGVGNEGEMEFYARRITVDNDRQLVKMKNVKMSKQRVNFSILQSARAGLVDKARFQLEDDITTRLVDTTEGRVRGRYLYGAADSNWNAVHATALQAVDNTDDKLTTTMIDIAKRKAMIPVNAITKIRPMKVKSMSMSGAEEWFVFVAHPFSIRDMIINDASWKNAQLNIPPLANRQSPLYTGSAFKGSWNGVLIYEWDRVALETSTIQVSHNLLLGAQAGAVVWAQRSVFGEEMQDVGHNRIFELHEIRGVDKVVFNVNAIDGSKSNEDHGVVHVLAAALND